MTSAVRAAVRRIAASGAICLSLCFFPPAVSFAQGFADEDEQMDQALKTFGYVSGQACQCQSEPKAKTAIERRSLEIATGILRLFGSDRAFYFAAAFGAGVTEHMDPKTCPEAMKQYDVMLARLKALAER